MEEFSTKKFIDQIKDRSSLWDTRVSAYADKDVKNREWEDLAAAIFPDWDNCEEKTSRVTEIKRRWKNIKDCYSRDLRECYNKGRTVKGKSGYATTKKRKYRYSRNLSFLEPVFETRSASVNKEHSTENDFEEDTDVIAVEVANFSPHRSEILKGVLEKRRKSNFEEANDNVVDIKNFPNQPLKTIKDVTKKNGKRCFEETDGVDVNISTYPLVKKVSTHATEIVKDVAKKNGKEFEEDILVLIAKGIEANKASEEDEDRLFLLSLLKEVKKVPEENKLYFKAELMLLLKKYQNDCSRDGVSFPLNWPSNLPSHPQRPYGRSANPFQIYSSTDNSNSNFSPASTSGSYYEEHKV